MSVHISELLCSEGREDVVWGLVSSSILTQGDVEDANPLLMGVQTTGPNAHTENNGLLSPLQSLNRVKWPPLSFFQSPGSAKLRACRFDMESVRISILSMGFPHSIRCSAAVRMASISAQWLQLSQPVGSEGGVVSPSECLMLTSLPLFFTHSSADPSV